MGFFDIPNANMAAGDEAPVATGAPSTERNDASNGEAGGANQGSDNNRGKKGKKGDRGRGEWRWVVPF